MVNSDKKFLFFVVYSIVLLFTIYFSYTFISSYIQQKREYELFKQSWQYVADTNFETEVEIDEETNEERVVNLISTPEQLAGAFLQSSSVQAYDIGSMTNKKTYNRYGTYKLTCNVNLSGKTWTSNDFYGTLYGGSFVISNLSMSKNQENLGFVSKLTGTIKDVFFDNIDVSNSNTNGSAYRTGGVAGYVNGGKIENVSVVSGKIWGNSWNNQNNDRCVGGIAGYMDRGTIKNCKNAASLNYGKFIGGIVGKMNGGTTTNCINYANIEDNNGNKYPRYGGICGESYGTITLCMNRGNVKCNISTEWESEVNGVKITFYGDIKVGGIVGDANTYAVTKCENYGTVSGGNSENTTTYAGGIAGHTKIGIQNCYNGGSVTAQAKKQTSSGKSKGGKDAEKIDEINESSVYVIYNQWRDNYWYYTFVSKSCAIYTTQAYAGGIVGKRGDTSKSIINCYSTGSISGGTIKYKDTYEYVYSYSQKLKTFNTVTWTPTYYYETSARNYVLTLEYTYEYLYSPLVGNCGEGMDNISNNAGNKDFSTTRSYIYNLSATDYHYSDFSLLADPITGVLSGLLTENKKKDNYPGTDITGYSWSEITKTKDSALFSVTNLGNMKCRIDASSTSISVKSKYSLSSDNSGKKGDHEETLGSQSLNQVSPSSEQYSKTTSASSILNTINGSNAWKIDSSKNSGYPVIKDLYW